MLEPSLSRMKLTVMDFIVLNRMREQLAARGARSIRGLSRSFKLFDSYDGNRKVDAQEFYIGLQENGVKVSHAEAEVSAIQTRCLVVNRFFL